MKKRIFIVCICIIYSTISLPQESEKNPKFKFSFSERLRLTTIDRSITLDREKEAWTFNRWRTYLGTEYAPNEHWAVKLELGNEARIWISPASKKSTIDEIFVNQFYIDYKMGALPLDIRLGRQNLMFDEGFVCMDGNPLVGSRSAYFNAIKATCRIDKKNEVTAFFSYNPEKENIFPVIHKNNPEQLLEEQTNKGMGIYYKSKIETVGFSAYYFHKNYLKNDLYPKAHTNAIGSRLLFPFLNGFTFTTELTCQFGKTGNWDRRSYGGYARLEYNFGESVPVIRRILSGAFYLSGDNPKTEKVEGWDPLWSRWPKWSESYIYTLIQENQGKVGYWSNINSLHAGIAGSVSSKVDFTADYHHLLAPEYNGTQFCSGGGKRRGSLLVMKLNYPIDKRWSGHFLWEHFKPGNFYFKGADKYDWMRFELLYKF